MKLQQAVRFPLVLAVLTVSVLATSGCGKQSPLATVTHPGPSLANAHRISGVPGAAVHLEGRFGPGALYSIDVPETWNGDLVLYAHGYTYPQLPIAMPGGLFPGIREEILARGAAIAATSFSENGFAEAEGARQLHQLQGIFEDQVGPPNRRFLIGTSLGGLIGLDLLESFPAQYAGAVSVSGPVGGSRAEFNYVGDVRALWDLLMPWKFPGTFTQPAGGDFPANQVMACLAGNSQQAGMIAFIHRPSPDRLRVNFLPAPQQAMGQTMGASIAYTCGFHWYGMADAVDRAHGHMLYDNHDVVYVDDGMVPQQMLDWVNANIARYTATPDAGSFLKQHYEPTGSLRQPFLTVHAVDPQVPIQHEDILYDKVAAAGQLDHLLQFRYMNRFGHTDAFTGTEVALAYDALLEWVRTGVKPPTPFTVVP